MNSHFYESFVSSAALCNSETPCVSIISIVVVVVIVEEEE